MPHHGDESEHEHEHEDLTPVDEAHDAAPEGDALAQAEAILKEAGIEAEAGDGAGPETETGETVETDLAAERLADLKRLQAEYVNYRRRVERDRDVARDAAVISVLNSLLPVLDDIDAARQAGDLESGPFAAIALKLENVLAGYGLVRIEESGVAFDPNIHEALMQQASADVEADTVSQVLRFGYKSNDRTLRPAQVIVAVPE
jgi:molecular chaperone GrpE